MSRILITEDDQTTQTLLSTYLTQAGYDGDTAGGGQEALALVEARHPDLVVLDVMMPGMDGWQTMSELRKRSCAPVIFLTALSSQADVIRGLELGADDYLRKPFSMKELGLRVQALLRRSGGKEPLDPGYSDGSLEIDFLLRRVCLNGVPARLTPTEFRLLAYLVRNRDRAVPHAEILREVWGPEYAQDSPTLQVYIRYLREKVEPNPRKPVYIRTEWGIGYRFTGKCPTE
jgi:DNA-binding response OmpR family regulator